MLEHVSVRCGDHAFLLPAENVVQIEPAPPEARFVRRAREPRDVELFLDLRTLLGVANRAPLDQSVFVRWQSTVDAHRATLIVDAVEGVVNLHPAEIIDAVFLPARLRPYCQGVVRDAGGRVKLRVRPDVVISVRRRDDRRRLLDALLAPATVTP